MYSVPSGATATPWGLESMAEVAGPPSPLNPGVPVPATVVMMPLASTRRTRSTDFLGDVHTAICPHGET